MGTTPWSIETPWAVCHVCVTSVELCQGVYVMTELDNVHAKKGWREHSVPTVSTTTITGVYPYRVRGEPWTKAKLSSAQVIHFLPNVVQDAEALCCCITNNQPCKGALLMSFCVLSGGLSQGCVPCICDSRGTVGGSVCDSTTGQCVCLPTRYGKDCSGCRPGELEIWIEHVALMVKNHWW